MTASCPLCSADVALPSNVELSEVIPCAECNGELEVVTVDPVMLEPFEEEEK